MKISLFHGLAPYHEHLKQEAPLAVGPQVTDILNRVRQEKDQALRHYSKHFDGIDLEHIRVPLAALEEALKTLDPSLKHVLETASHNIRIFHQRQLPQSQLHFAEDGTILGWKVTPIDRVGVYIPGGRAVYPSSVLMNVIPAQVAGVAEIAMVSPPTLTGFPHVFILAAAQLLGITEVYAVGGAQAIGALAYGTESIRPVYKITGPGNAYVAEAKRQVYGKVGIDSIAGPSDITILCDDESMPVEFLVRDLIAQAEHDPEASALLVTTSFSQAQAVAQRLEELIPSLPRHEIIEASFARGSAIIMANNKQDAIEIVNEIAPEHLELLTQTPFEDLPFIRNAGAIFLGRHTPEAVGDYFAGPNHTLPTAGGAKFSSPLGVADFLKTSSILQYSRHRLSLQGPQIIQFAESEQLSGHAASIHVRLESTKKLS